MKRGSQLSEDEIIMKIKWLIILFLLKGSFTQVMADNKSLILGIHPYLEHSELKQRFEPLANHLSQQLGKPVLIRVGQSYQQHINAYNQGLIDIAFLGPSLFVEFIDHIKDEQMLARLEDNGKPNFFGNIIVLKNSNINTLAGLKGKVFAFGDPQSTMSTLVPLALLKQSGIELDDFRAYKHYEGHNNVALSVLAGLADAGAVKNEVYIKYKDKGLKSLQESPRISEHLFLASKELPKPLVKKTREALLNLTSDDLVKTVLKPIKKSVTGLVTVKKSDYDNLRNLIGTLNGKSE